MLSALRTAFGSMAARRHNLRVFRGVWGSEMNLARRPRARARLFVCAPSPRSKMFAFLIGALRPNFRFISLRGEIV